MQHTQQTTRARRWAIFLAALCLGGICVIALLSGCGSGGGASTETASTSTSQPQPTGTPGMAADHANLFSRIDYPFQIPVGSSDTVTLTLSPDVSILRVTPTPNPQGTAPASLPGAVIPLPTNPGDYQDISVSLNIIGNTGPVVWNETGAVSRSLLQPAQPGQPRRYVDQSLTFAWRVQAVSAGENTAQIVLTLSYTYLDGSFHSGTTNLTPNGVPMVAITPSFLTITLPNFKLPIISLASLGGIIALFNMVQNIISAIETGRKVKEVAVKVIHHRHAQPDDLPPTLKRKK